MKLPAELVIAREKLTLYLLVRQTRGDKSAFLSRAGYSLSNPERLERDLREQVLTQDALELQSNQFDQYYEITAEPRGPNGASLPIRTIWLREHLSRACKFITLIPVRRSR